MEGQAQRVLCIAYNTIRESVRNRIIYALLGTTGVVMLTSLIFGFVTLEEGDKIRIIMDFSLSAISIFGTIAAIFLGTNLIYQEIEKRTIYTLLARPLSRSEFIGGKYLGLIAVNGLCLAVTGGAFLLFVLLNGGGLNLSLIQALYMIFLELMVITGIALVFSVTAHPIEGAVFAFVLTLAGHSTQNLQRFGKEVLAGKDSTLSGLFQSVVDVLYILLPNLENFNIRTEVATGIPIPPSLLGLSTVYALVYALILFFLAHWSFSRKAL